MSSSSPPSEWTSPRVGRTDDVGVPPTSSMPRQLPIAHRQLRGENFAECLDPPEEEGRPDDRRQVGRQLGQRGLHEPRDREGDLGAGTRLEESVHGGGRRR